MHVFDLHDLVSSTSAAPLLTLDMHALGVMDAAIGPMGGGVVYSVGKDCMLWINKIDNDGAGGGEKRRNGYVYPRMLAAVCVDVLERVCFLKLLMLTIKDGVGR